MQELLFLDRIDGSRTFKCVEHEILYYSLFYLTPEDIVPISTNGKFGLNMNFTRYLKEETDIPIDLRRSIVDNYLKDPNSARSAYTVTHYLVNNGNNYLFSSPLSSALMRCQTNLPLSLFKRHFYGYLEIPNLKDDLDNSNVCGIFVSILPVENTWSINIMAITLLNGLYSNRVFYYVLRDGDEDKTMEEVVNQVSDWEKKKETNNFDHKAYKEGVTSRTIINAIAYIISSSEDLREEINIFANKQSKAEGQRRSYTEKAYISLGKNFEFLRVQSCDKTWVEPFYRWQPCGEGRSKIKLTLVRGHERNYKVGVTNA